VSSFHELGGVEPNAIVQLMMGETREVWNEPLLVPSGPVLRAEEVFALVVARTKKRLALHGRLR
jgi:hypothetical protein